MPCKLQPYITALNYIMNNLCAFINVKESRNADTDRRIYIYFKTYIKKKLIKIFRFI